MYAKSLINYLLIVAFSLIIDQLIESFLVLAEQKQDYEAKCLVERSPDFKNQPFLNFFSAKNQKLGCEGGLKIQLNVNPTIEDNSSIEDSKVAKILPDKDNLKTNLIDGQLYDPKTFTYVIVHGFLSDSMEVPLCDIKDMILEHSNSNVFITDWSGGSKPSLSLDYGQAVANTEPTAKALSVFIQWLLNETNQIDAAKVHLIGHSLGAHLVGFVGYELKTLGRITGLDPAGPCFGSNQTLGEPIKDENQTGKSGNSNKRRRLSPASAKLVIALHTDALVLGLNENCAHYNVWVNGGYQQPNCSSTSVSDRVVDIFSFNLKNAFDTDVSCNHQHAYKMFDSYANKKNDETEDGKQNEVVANHQNVRSSSTKDDNEDERCYQMAYECDSWEAFKLGECGICKDNSTECIFIGLYFNQPVKDVNINDPKKKLDLDDKDYSKAEKDVIKNDSDNEYNVEDEENLGSSKEGKKAEKKGAGSGVDANLHKEVSRGMHFIKTAGRTPHCLYHYQVVIGTSSSFVSDDIKYYIQLPISNEALVVVADSAKDLDQSSPNRLIQVSHLIKGDSKAGKKLKKSLEGKESTKSLYTALITFHSSTSEECNENETHDFNWHLCAPLKPMEYIKLWASKKGTLEKVEFLDLNYMSGLHENQRAKYSQKFEKITNEQIKTGRISETEAKQSPADEVNKSLVGSFFGSVKDLVFGGSGDANLKYFVKLKLKNKNR